MQLAAVVPLLAGQSRRRWIATIEICVVFAIVMVLIWFWQGKSHEGTIFAYLVMSGIAIGGWVARKETFASLGLVNKWWVILGVLLIAGKIVVHNFHLFPHLGYFGNSCLGFAGYCAWALIQELMLNSFFVMRLRICFVSPAYSWTCAGIIFSLCHFPNPALIVVTLFWGAGAGYLFLTMRKRNLYILSLVHGTVGYGLATVLPHLFHWSHPMAVGPRFLQ